jgi:hypothetical protein
MKDERDRDQNALESRERRTTMKKLVAVKAQFTDEVTVDDAVCGIRYTIGTL